MMQTLEFFLFQLISSISNFVKGPNWRYETPLARTLPTHQQSQRLILLREIKAKTVLVAAVAEKKPNNKNCILNCRKLVCYFGKKPGAAVCASTICWLNCCLQGASCSKTAAPWHDRRDSPSSREHFLVKQQGRGQQESPNNPEICTQPPEGELGVSCRHAL